jgi:hypothetical protein
LGEVSCTPRWSGEDQVTAAHFIHAVLEPALVGQHERCPGGASGHETDKISRHSPPGTKLLAKGLNPDGGGAEMARYETATGGAVFAAGSIVWPSSLLVDRHVSRITRNVLERYLR